MGILYDVILKNQLKNFVQADNIVKKSKIEINDYYINDVLEIIGKYV